MITLITSVVLLFLSLCCLYSGIRVYIKDQPMGALGRFALGTIIATMALVL